MNDAIQIIKGKIPSHITGKNIGIAILDTGISPVADFVKPTNRISCFVDFINDQKEPYDDNGHGTHVSGIACGNGYLSHGRYSGIAPESNIIGLKILDSSGHGSAGCTIDAVEWILENKEQYGIRIVNMSIGTSDKTVTAPLTKAVNKLWDNNIVVVTASGNKEETGIVAPGISQKIITVGNYEDRVFYKIKKGNTFYYKPDIFAPGENIVSCKANDTSSLIMKKMKLNNDLENYVEMSGTSMATPIISGAAALLLQTNPLLTADQVKKIICDSTKEKEPIGMLNVKKMLGL